MFSWYPYPDGSGFGIEYSLDQPSDVCLQIINAAGIRSRTLVTTRSQEAGSYSLHWNGESDAGNPVADGIYLLVFSAKVKERFKRWYLRMLFAKVEYKLLILEVYMSGKFDHIYNV